MPWFWHFYVTISHIRPQIQWNVPIFNCFAKMHPKWWENVAKMGLSHITKVIMTSLMFGSTISKVSSKRRSNFDIFKYVISSLYPAIYEVLVSQRSDLQAQQSMKQFIPITKNSMNGLIHHLPPIIWCELEKKVPKLLFYLCRMWNYAEIFGLSNTISPVYHYIKVPYVRKVMHFAQNDQKFWFWQFHRELQMSKMPIP